MSYRGEIKNAEINKMKNKSKILIKKSSKATAVHFLCHVEWKHFIDRLLEN